MVLPSSNPNLGRFRFAYKLCLKEAVELEDGVVLLIRVLILSNIKRLILILRKRPLESQILRQYGTKHWYKIIKVSVSTKLTERLVWLA